MANNIYIMFWGFMAAVVVVIVIGVLLFMLNLACRFSNYLISNFDSYFLV